MPMIEEIRTVTADGRIVIPWAIQEALGLEHGGRVCFHVENGVITLHSAECAREERAFMALMAVDGGGDAAPMDRLRLELRALLAESQGQD